MAEEHTPHPVLVILMALVFWAMAAAALAFWAAAAIWSDGLDGLVSALDPATVAVFAMMHIPAAIIGVLLWQWRRHAMPLHRRVMLEAATLYFGLAVLFSIFMNYLAVRMLDTLMGG